MKVLGIVCSSRKLGNSDLLLRQALKICQHEDLETKYLRLTDLEFKPCRGCLKCVYQGGCFLQDEFSELLEYILEYNALILAAPTYLFGAHGLIKLVTDRALALSKHLPELENKKRLALTISISSKKEWNTFGTETLNLFALSYAYEVINYHVANAAGPGEVLLNTRNEKEIKIITRDLINSFQQENPIKKIHESNQCPVCFSRNIRFLTNKQIQCCVCGIKGTIQLENNQIRFHFTPQEIANHFWTIPHRKEHINGWMQESKNSFLANRQAIKEFLQKYR